MKRKEGQFEGAGKTTIYWQHWPARREPRAVVVIAHGLGEHSGRYAHVASALLGEGCTVFAIDHRGHGRSGAPRGYVDRWQSAVDDIDVLIDKAKREYPNLPLFLLGHSMGGALSLAYAIRCQQKLSGLILSGPAVALDGAPPFTGVLAKLLSRLVPRLGLFGIDPSVVSRDPDASRAYGDDPLNCHGKVPVRTLAEIVRLVEALPKRLSSLRLPMLVMHGTADRLAGVDGSKRVIAKVRSTDKTLLLYDGLYHEIFNEIPADRARVLRDLCGWVRKRTPASAERRQRRGKYVRLSK